MATDTTEEEQIEALKKWLEENGMSMVMTIVIVLGGIFGYRAWENSVQQAGEAASAIYEDLSRAVINAPAGGLSDNLRQTGITLGKQLKEEHGDSAYAIFGAFHLAKVHADSGDYGAAEQELRWVIDNGAPASLEVVARVRLARALAEQEKLNEALVILDSKIEKGAHLISWEETRGDILYQKGDMDGAREAYQIAVNTLGDDTRPYLQMKLDDLTVARPTGGDEEEDLATEEESG